MGEEHLRVVIILFVKISNVFYPDESKYRKSVFVHW